MVFRSHVHYINANFNQWGILDLTTLPSTLILKIIRLLGSPSPSLCCIVIHPALLQEVFIDSVLHGLLGHCSINRTYTTFVVI